MNILLPRKIKYVALISLLIIAGCYVGPSAEEIDNLLQPTLGMHQADLILKIGPPVRTADDGRGGQILIYEEYKEQTQTFYTTPGVIKTNTNRYSGNRTTYTPPSGFTQSIVSGYRVMFWVDEDGIIYNYKWKAQ